VAGSYELVRYDQTLRDAVLDLQQHHWGADRAANARYLDWKYFESPYADASRIYLALHEGKAVAMRGFFGSRWEVGTPTSVFDMLCAGDLVIDPAHRGHGLFTALMEYVVSDVRGACPYFFNLSAGSATRLGALTMGWRDIGPIPKLVGTTRVGLPSMLRRAGSLLTHRFSGKSVSAFDRIDRLIRGGRAIVGNGIVLSKKPQPEEMARLVRDAGHDGRIRHRRDAAYFEWRFRQPRGTYRFLYKMNASFESYLVLQIKTGTIGWPVSIVDCEARTSGSISELLTAALDMGDLGRVHVWSSAMASEDIETLRRFGFLERKIKSFTDSFSTVLVRPATPELPERPWLLGGRDVLDARNWDLRQLYSDGF
jgi:GNAT superfamily N-acetyltransferase